MEGLYLWPKAMIPIGYRMGGGGCIPSPAHNVKKALAMIGIEYRVITVIIHYCITTLR